MFNFFQAQHNTRMLATYAAIDPRVQYLGYTMVICKENIYLYSIVFSDTATEFTFCLMPTRKEIAERY
mgnify:CR=1 FL=1